jgi:3-phenylpropionate/cinnamic acid dioxygenase small subunit
MDKAAKGRVGDSDWREIERFLYREARLLDERRFHEWLTLLADDIRYWMVGRSNRYPRASLAIAMLDPDRYGNRDPEEADELALLDETKTTLAARVARLATGMAWAEDPPSRTRHLVTNIEVEPGERDGEFRVRANFLVYRSRAGTEQDFYVGGREDLLRRTPEGWQIAHRKLLLDQNVLLAKNISIFF